MQTTTIERFAVPDPASEIAATKVWVFYNDIVSEHEVGTDGALGPGHWIDTKSVVKALDKTVRPEKAAVEEALEEPVFLPHRILCSTPKLLVWHVSPSKRPLVFTAKGLKQLSGVELQMPGMVFALVGTSLFAFAVKVASVTLKSRLYEAPFPNMFRDNRVCQGSMPKHGFAPADADKWTDSFFESKFTHQTFVQYWKGVAKGCTKDLKSTDKTLEDIFDDNLRNT